MVTQKSFNEAVARLHASRWKKLFLIGPKRFAIRRWARWSGKGMERRVELFFGSPMTVVLPEIISEQIYSYGLFDETVTWLAMQAVGPGDVVLDVGAHFGYFTLLFAHLVGDSGRVISFEPTPSTFSVLQKNAGHVSNVTLLNAAAGGEKGRLAIADYGLTYSAWNTLSQSSRMPDCLDEPRSRITVQVFQLDEWCGRDSVVPQVIKVDAENFEAEVIRGLQGILSEHHPRILMETGSRHALEVGKYLTDRGYAVLVGSPLGSLRVQTPSDDVLLNNKDVLFVHSTALDGLTLAHERNDDRVA